MRTLVAILALSALSSPAFATLCKYLDESGNVTYSDSNVKGAKKQQCFETPTAPPAPTAQAPKGAAPGASEGTSGAPMKASGDPTRGRADARRKILQDELAQEEKALAEAKKTLAEGEDTRLGSERNYQRYVDRVQPLRDKAAQHEKNVEALRRELGNLR